MKAKKIIIGLAVIIALLITIGSALAAISVSDTLLDGESKTYNLNGKEFDVTLVFTDSSERARFNVNGETTPLMTEGEEVMIEDEGVIIKLIDVLYQDYPGGIHQAKFSLSLPVLEITDVKVGKTGGNLVSYTDGSETAAFQPGDEITVKVTIRNNGNVPLENIEVAVNADPTLGNFPVPQSIPDPFHLQAGQEKEVTYAYKIPPSLNAGFYPVEFEVKGRDESVPYNEYVSARSLVLKVEQKQNKVYVESVALYVNNVKDDNALTCQEKQNNVELKAKLIDNGLEPETVVKVTLTNPALGLNLNKIATVKGESSEPVTFSLDAKKITGEHQLTLKVYRAAQFPDKLYDTKTLTVSGQDCTVSVSSASPSGASLTLKENGFQDFSITLQNPANVAVSYEWFVGGNSVPGEVANSFTFNANNKVGDHTVKVAVTGQGVNLPPKEWAVKVADRPVDADKFPGKDTTDLKAVQDIKDVPSFTLENSFGKVRFAQNVDLSEILFLADVVSITDGKVTVKALELNKPATITLKKIFQKPLMLKDSKKCLECTVVPNPAAGTFVFTVPGFSTYEVVEELPADFSISDIVFTEVKQGDAGLTKTVTVKNVGTFDSLTNVKVELVEVDEDYKNNLAFSDGLSDDKKELSAQEQASVTLKINVPNDAKTDVIAKLKVSGYNANNVLVVKEANVKVQLKSFLKVLNVEVNGDDDGELSLSDDVNKVKFDLKNEHTKDMKADSIKVTATLLDDKDKEVTSEELDLPDELADGEDIEVTVELDLKNEDLDEDKYTLEITVEGKDTDSNTHKTTHTQTVKVDRSDEEVSIARAELTNSKLLCSTKTSLHVKLKNNGDKDFNNLVLKVRNNALNLDLTKSNLDLEDYASDGNEYEATFDLDLTDAAADTYPLTVEVFDNDDEVLDSQEVQLEVKACVTESTASGTKEYYADEKLTAELQKKLAERQTANQSVVEASFRESDKYVLLLGVLVVLMSMAALLSLVVMLVKKR